MKDNKIRVEPPRKLGDDAEFFLQTAPPDTVTCTAHIHSAVELLYINEGSYCVTLDDERYELKKGELILFCSGAIHSVISGNMPQNSYYVIKISPTFFVELAKREAGAEYIMRFALNKKGNKLLWSAEELEESGLKAIIDRLISEYRSQGYAAEVAVKLGIMELLLTILRESASEDAPINDRTAETVYSVMGYVQRNFAEDIDEKELAESYGMSYSYFSRSFKRVTGMTFKTYLNRTRISKAERLLLRKGGTISETATACGYNSISYFISVYRSVTGKTPYKALRDANKGKL